MQLSEDQIRGIEQAHSEYLVFQEAKAKMHAVSGALKRMIEHTDIRNANYYLDEGTAYVKKTYHTGGEDDTIRRDVND